MCTHVVDIFQNVTTYLHINAQPLGLRFHDVRLAQPIIYDRYWGELRLRGFRSPLPRERQGWKNMRGKPAANSTTTTNAFLQSKDIHLELPSLFFLLQWCYQTAFPEQKTHRTRKNRDQRDWGWDHDTLVGAIKSLQSEAGPTNSELIGSYLCHRVTGWTPHFHALPSGACHPSNEKKGPQVVWGM